MFGRYGTFRPPWPGRMFNRGDLKIVILGLIQDKPRYGYEVIRALEERSHGFYTPSPGTVYPTLQMLEEMGYVTAEQQEGKKVYTITDEGRAYLLDQGDVAEQVKKHMREHWPPQHMTGAAETMKEFGRLGGLLAGQARSAGPHKMKLIRDVISRAYSEIEGIINS